MRAVFLDLNGTLVMPVKVLHPQEYTRLPGAIDAIRLLNQHGYICPVVTVQSRIAKRIFSADDFLTWFRTFQAELHDHGAAVLGPYLCSHRWRDECPCKKPKPHLYQQAAADLNIDLSQSIVIGDTLDDVEAARTLGCTSCLVRTGWGEQAVTERNGAALATFVATDVLDAACWIVGAAPSARRL